jgi:hypothetical protein
LSRGDPDARTFVERLGLGDDHEGLYRILYCIHTQLTCYLDGAKGKSAGNLGAGQIRLPAAVGLATDTLSFWSGFLESRFGRNVPVLLTLPLQESWLDATCGEPASREFYSLRVKPEVLAVASEVAYKIPDEFRKAYNDLVGAITGR